VKFSLPVLRLEPYRVSSLQLQITGARADFALPCCRHYLRRVESVPNDSEMEFLKIAFFFADMNDYFPYMDMALMYKGLFGIYQTRV
jgi:hypothetical protein